MDIARLEIPDFKTQSIVYDDSVDTSSIQNVLLIDDSVKDFQQYANVNTFPIIYNRWCTRDQLLEVLTSKFQNISRIAVVSHFSETPYFLNEDILFSDTNTQFMVDVVKQFHVTHIDFLACNTLQSTSWTNFYTKLYDATGVPIGASNDNTGNLKYGGDWVLESTHEDIQTIYLNDQIQNYSSLLLTFSFTYLGKTLSYITTGANTVAVASFQSMSLSGSVTIPATVSYNSVTYQVTSTDEIAFDSCTSLTSITIPSSVTSIGSFAFDSCTSLTSISIPSSVTSIGSNVFNNCTSLTSIIIPSSVNSIGTNAFRSCTSLSTITIPSSVTSIGTYAFNNCTSLTSISVDGANANYSSDSFGVLFNKNKTILIQYPIGNTRTTYTIPSSVTSIGGSAFDSCTSLTSITIPSSVNSIGSNAFDSCTSLTSITIPSSVTSIGSQAFYNCTSLTSIIIPSSVTSIGTNAFYNCTGLTNIIIPSSVTSIDSQAFYKCTGLTNISFASPSSVTSIDSQAFRSCTSLSTIAIPSSVISIGNAAFYNCTLLTNVTFEGIIPTIEPYNFTNGSDTAYTIDVAGNSTYLLQFFSNVAVLPPTANICFKAGTKVTTDQGIISIEKITERNTISNKKVLFVSKTTNIDNYMILMKKGSLYENVPNNDTYLTGNHKVFFNREMVKAKDLVNGNTITKEKMRNELVYNVLLEGEKQGKMIAHGMITETLSPSNLFVKLLMDLDKMSEEEKMRIIPQLNKKLCEEDKIRKMKTKELLLKRR